MVLGCSTWASAFASISLRALSEGIGRVVMTWVMLIEKNFSSRYKTYHSW